MVRNVIICLLACTAGAFGQNLPNDVTAFVDSIMHATYRSDQPGGVMLIGVDGVPVYRKAFGLASAELGIPNTPEHSFKVGSISKQFTAVSMLMLVEAGKVSLEDEVTSYLPWFDAHGRKITVRNLLTHTSGVPSYTEKEGFEKKAMIDVTKQEIVEYVMGDSLLFEPGTDWSYSNTGYALANLVIEKASGTTFEAFLRSNIFDPLGMAHTYVITEDSVLRGLVSGYDKVGPDRYKPTSFLSPTWPYGGGQVISSVDDMLKWDEALYTEKLVKRRSLTQAWTSFTLPDGRKTNYGFGWAVGSWKGQQIITHAGGINGFVSDGARVPAAHVYVIQISNNTSAPPNKVKEIALRVAGTPYWSPEPVQIDVVLLKPLEGVYEVKRSGGRLTTNSTAETQYRTLTIERDTLFEQPTGGTRRALVPVGTDLFTIGSSATYIRVVRASDGTVEALDVYQEAVNYGPHAYERRTEKPLPAATEVVSIDPSVLLQYEGNYQLVPGFIIKVTTEGSRIFAQATGQSRFEIFPRSESVFFLKVVDATMEFVRDADGKVSTMILNQGGRRELKRVD